MLKRLPKLPPFLITIGLSVAGHVVLMLVQLTPTAYTVPLAQNPLSEEEAIEIADADSVLGERVIPGAENERNLVTTEDADNDHKPETPDKWGDRDQVVEKETRAPLGGEFVAGDPILGGSEDSLGSLGLLPDALTLDAEAAAGPNRSEKGVYDFELTFGSTRDEYLDGVANGSRTLLSTREFAHWIYFDRIKKKIAPRWRPEIQRRARALVASQRALKEGVRKTKVYVELDREGDIVDLAVIASSQSGYLDEAAIKAFKDVGRFPNPPEELLSNDKVRFNWDFVLDINQIQVAVQTPKRRTAKDRLDRLN